VRVSPLLTVDEAAARLRCARTRVFALLASGVLERGPKYGRKTVITAASVEAALQAPEPEPAPLPRPAPRTAAPKSHAAELAAMSDRLRSSWKKPRHTSRTKRAA
jgi:excisionase family DNA binding protein